MTSQGDSRIISNARIERRAQLWIRAYPRRWRQDRGEELLGLVVDLAGRDARRLGATAALDLVRGGWGTRWREHPPLHTWLLYRLLDRRIPEAYRSWALDDIDGFWYPIRRSMFFLASYPAFLYALNVVDPWGPVPPAWHEPAWHYLVWAILMAVFLLIALPEVGRNPARHKHVAPRAGEPWVEGALVGWDVPRHRVEARSVLTWALPLLGIAGAASVVTSCLAPKVLLAKDVTFTPWNPDMVGGFELVVAPMVGLRVVAVGALVVALGLGVLGAALAGRRLDRFLGKRPAQPYRALRPISGTGKARVLFGIVIVGTLVWLEVSGRLVLGPSVLLGSVALLLLPGVVVALVVTRGSDDADLAAADVWRIVTRGRLPAVDPPAWGLRPLPAAQVPDARNGAVHG